MVDWKTYKGDKTWPNNFKEQQNKWGYLNNPRWQTSPQTKVSYTGNEPNEPQVWTMLGDNDHYDYSLGTSVDHFPCGHWHKHSNSNPPVQEYEGQVYVTDRLEAYGINVFDLNGYRIRTIQTPYNGWTGPAGICVYNDEVYVTIGSEQFVWVCDLYGNFKRQIGSPGTSNGHFNSLVDIFVANDLVYTLESDVQTSPYGIRIQIWDTQGNYQNSFKPTGGSGAGSKIWVSDSNIYVMSVYYTKYSLSHSSHWPTTEYRLAYANLGIGGTKDLAGYGDNFYCTANGTRICKLDSSMTLISDFHPDSPNGIDVYEDEIYSLDNGSDKVQVFSLDGDFIREWQIHPTVGGYSTNSIFVYARPI